MLKLSWHFKMLWLDLFLLLWGEQAESSAHAFCLFICSFHSVSPICMRQHTSPWKELITSSQEQEFQCLLSWTTFNRVSFFPFDFEIRHVFEHTNNPSQVSFIELKCRLVVRLFKIPFYLIESLLMALINCERYLRKKKVLRKVLSQSEFILWMKTNEWLILGRQTKEEGGTLKIKHFQEPFSRSLNANDGSHLVILKSTWK